ncbi:TPA: hypothetical protein ACH3X3_002163 [Trebouxia sp. C0006]
MSDTTSEVGRQTSASAEVYRLEQILQRPARLSDQLQSGRRSSRGPISGAEGPPTVIAEAQPSTIEQDERQPQAQPRQTGRVSVDDLECSALEKALKEQVYRLAGQWEQGAQRLTEHLQDALQDLTAVRQQENDLLKRRVDLCHQELEDQVAELERSFHLKVDECKQQMLARIADQKADCEMAIRAKAESLLGILEKVDSVLAPASPDYHHHTLPASQRAAYSSPDHRLAHAACACYDNDEEVQYSSAEAGGAGVPESWAAVQPMRRRLNYLVSSPTQERKTPLAVQKYMNKAADRPQEWWKPARLTVQDGRKRVTQHSSRGLLREEQYDSPATERLASLGVSFRKYRPCSCRTRSGMLAPRPPLRLSHLLEQSDDDV